MDFILGGDGLKEENADAAYAAAAVELDDGMTLGRFFFVGGGFFLLLEPSDELDELRAGLIDTPSIISARYRSELLRELRASRSDTAPLRFSDASRRVESDALLSHDGDADSSSSSTASGFLHSTNE